MPRTQTRLSGGGRDRGGKRTATTMNPGRPPQEQKKKEKEEMYFLWKALFVSLPIILFIQWVWPTLIPFDTFQFWNWDGDTIWNGLMAGWPIYVWGLSVQFLLSTFAKFKQKHIDEAEDFLIGGAFISVIAGVTEEISFRWIFFLGACFGVQFANFLFFGWFPWIFGDWASFLEIPRLVSWYIAIPVADFFTAYKMHWLLVAQGWVVGAACLGANAKFRDGHKYQGPLGVINSWYLGLFFFWIMFEYGLVAAICVHIAYDMVIFSVLWFHAAARRSIQAMAR